MGDEKLHTHAIRCKEEEGHMKKNLYNNTDNNNSTHMHSLYIYCSKIGIHWDSQNPSEYIKKIYKYEQCTEE